MAAGPAYWIIGGEWNLSLTILLVWLVPAGVDLVTPLADINTLPVTAGELLLRTAGQLEGGGVGLAVVTVRAVLLYDPGALKDGSIHLSLLDYLLIY